MAELSSPLATGNAGTHFEHRVGGFYLGILLTHGLPPLLPPCLISQVHLQSGRVGYKTDDLLVIGTGAGSRQYRLVAQVKRTFTVGGKNDDCIATFTRAWQDFTSPDRFDPAQDTLGLIVQQASATLNTGLRNLLDCAEASMESGDFLTRLKLPQYWGQIAQDYGATIRTILDLANGTAVTDDQFWRFLRAFNFAALDLGLSGSVAEAQLVSRLADTCTTPAEAAGTLDEFIVLAGNTAARAQSFNYDTLPQHLRERHRAAARQDTLLGKLRDHADFVARGVRDTLGTAAIALPRAVLVDPLLSALESNRIVLVAGEAGAGKSAVAKTAFRHASQNTLGLAFRAESFAKPHLDDVLAPFGINFAALNRATAGFPRKILWIESVERLLEKSERQAFTDLLAAIAADPSWRLILTCRDYSAATIRKAFLDSSGFASDLQLVPPLSDEELTAVGVRLPALVPVLAKQKLRRLLRNPFILDQAARIDWSRGSLPANERELRSRVWQDLIRRDDVTAAAMPARRDDTFTQITLRRAQAMDAFANCHDLDPVVIQQLRQDGLVNALPGDDWMLAPAHDVLEDWALLAWLDRQFNRHRERREAFFREIGTFPALRRAYRRWLTECLDGEPALADSFALGVASDAAVPRHWRDDTLVAVLHSTEATGFLQRNRAAWRTDNFHLLRRIVHLLRVAGKGLPFWLKPGALVPGTFLTAQGEAWGCVADILHEERAHWTPADLPFLLGFMEDWASAVSVLNPYPAGSESIGRLCLLFLPKPPLDSWAFREKHSPARLVKIVLKVPAPVATELDAAIRGMLPKARWDTSGASPPALVLSLLHGYAVARDLPDLVFACLDRWLGRDITFARRRSGDSYSAAEVTFGLPEHLAYSTYPPSAWRGPFLGLLRNHPKRTIDYLLDVLNRASDVCFRKAGDGYKLTLRLPDGSEHIQWADAHLWGMYCSASSGPHILESILMALETWLLERAEAKDATVPGLLLDLIKRSNNVTVTAVVVSVCRAHPLFAVDAALVVFTAPVFFKWERQRAGINPGGLAAQISAAMPMLDAEKSMMEQERKLAAERPHNRLDLEWLACELQMNGRATEVQQWIDREEARLPPAAEQDESVLLWRLLLSRIDCRKWVIEGKTDDGHYRIGLTPLPAEIQQVVDRGQPTSRRTVSRIDLQHWGMKAFARDADAKPELWNGKLAAARVLADLQPLEPDDEIGRSIDESAAGHVAAVCVRDHLAELEVGDLSWCVDYLCGLVCATPDPVEMIRAGKGGTMDAARPAAYVLPILLQAKLPAAEHAKVETALATALTHAAGDVRAYAAAGLGHHGLKRERLRVLATLAVLAGEPALLQAAHDAQRKQNYEKQRPWDEVALEIRHQLRRQLQEPPAAAGEPQLALKLDNGFVRSSLRLVTAILGGAPTDPLTLAFLKHLIEELTGLWTKYERSSRSADRRPVEVELEVKQWICQTAASLPPSEARNLLRPIVERTATHPREVAEFLGLFATRLRTPGAIEVFWNCWKVIATRLLANFSAAHLANEHNDTHGLVLRLFLNLGWNDNRIDWPPVRNHEAEVDAFFDKFPDVEPGFSSYACYLQSVGGHSLPVAFPLLARKLRALPAGTELSSDVVFRLEVVLAHHVHAASAALKRDPSRREAVLAILDELVERGSSAAFLMRDDFLTP